MATQTTRYIFGSDAPLLFDQEPWNRLGFAVPNFGDNWGTLNQAIANLADAIGRAQLWVMTRVDAQRTQPPSPNVVKAIGKLVNRVQSVLAGRSKTYADTRLDELHATSNQLPWNIHPVPFFNSAITVNHWLCEYNRLCMIALTNIYQHSDNNLALTVTEAFANDIWQYFAEIKRLAGVELLGLAPDVVNAPDFTFTEDVWSSYVTIVDRVLLMEAINTPGPIASQLTEDDLRPLAAGLPANLILPLLKQYPVAGGELGGLGFSGAPLPDQASAPGTRQGEAVAPPGRTLGEPLI